MLYLSNLIISGLVGFARLCPGDVFEVAVRHGTQKWKTKGRMASSAQNWENDTIVFKSLLGDILSVKVCFQKIFCFHEIFIC